MFKFLYILSVIGFIISFIGLEVWIIRKWLTTLKEIKELKKQLKEDEEYFNKILKK